MERRPSPWQESNPVYDLCDNLLNPERGEQAPEYSRLRGLRLSRLKFWLDVQLLP